MDKTHEVCPDCGAAAERRLEHHDETSGTKFECGYIAWDGGSNYTPLTHSQCDINNAVAKWKYRANEAECALGLIGSAVGASPSGELFRIDESVAEAQVYAEDLIAEAAQE